MQIFSQSIPYSPQLPELFCVLIVPSGPLPRQVEAAMICGLAYHPMPGVVERWPLTSLPRLLPDGMSLHPAPKVLVGCWLAPDCRSAKNNHRDLCPRMHVNSAKPRRSYPFVAN